MATASKIVKSLLVELQRAEKNFATSAPIYQYLKQQESAAVDKSDKSALWTLSTYNAYLTASRRLTELHEQYARGEKSIEAAAAQVGLRLPETTK